MAKVMVGFTWVMSIAFVMIISGLDYLKYFIDEKFWVGLELGLGENGMCVCVWICMNVFSRFLDRGEREVWCALGLGWIG